MGCSPHGQIEETGRSLLAIGGLPLTAEDPGQFRRRRHHNNIMKLPIKLLALLSIGWGDTHAAPDPASTASANRVLMIDSSSMPIAAGKVTLSIGALQRANGVYSGDYKINVSPWFFNNEKGKLAIVVSDESLARINQGKVAAIIGTATTIGKGGRSRHIDATATPANNNRGTIKLWFTAGNRKMIFEPAYHFAEKGTVAVPAPAAETSVVFKLSCRPPVSHRGAMEAAEWP
jgi:hypothetical protein